MSESGCIEMLLSFENINIMNIKKMNKKSNYDFDYENIIRIFKKYKILVHASYVIGYDYDTKDYFQEILDFSNKHKFFLAGFNPTLRIPGTSIACARWPSGATIVRQCTPITVSARRMIKASRA